MAWHMKLKLPNFIKVTQIGETTTCRDVPRGRIETGSTATAAPSCTVDTGASTEIGTPDLDQYCPDDFQCGPIVSLHTIKQKASTAAWDQVRAALQKAAIESSALPTDQGCILCANAATHRCTSCGAWAYYCTSCFIQAHSKANFFHVGEVWEVRTGM